MTDLHEAAEAGDADAVRAILAGDPLRIRELKDAKTSALHRAARAGHGQVVELLLAAGANANARDYGGSTPLHLAARGGHLDCVQALLAHDAKASPMNEAGDTPLHEAARGGRQEAARLLLDHGADPNARGQCGGTPLHAAAGAGRRDVAELLLRGGALANARSTAHSKPWTPWHEAAAAGDEAMAELLLRHGGADKAAGPIDAHTAASRGYDGRLELLLDQDPDLPKSRDVLHKRTPLHWAAASGRGSIAEALLARGADPASIDKRGMTPAELAAAAGFRDLAERLDRAAAAAPEV
jgi:ankyrin repeat protein